jgi:hypothetical protein
MLGKIDNRTPASIEHADGNVNYLHAHPDVALIASSGCTRGLIVSSGASRFRDRAARQRGGSSQHIARLGSGRGGGLVCLRFRRLG